MKVLMVLVLTFSVSFCSRGIAQTIDKYLVLNVASHHVNSSLDFNEQNFGLSYSIGHRPIEQSSWENSLEFGFYKNSFSEISSYALVKGDFAIGKSIFGSEMRLGAFAGFFEYPSATDYARSHGIPTIGEFVLVPGLSATLRSELGVDLRLNVAPGAKQADAIVSVQIGFRY